jgi:hypothetical protein
VARWRPAPLTGLAIAVPLIMFGVHGGRYGRWIVDDAAISFAYARNLADGHGFVAQPGADPVEGFSNPLWTVILAVLHKARLFDAGLTIAGWPDYVLIPKLLGVGCFAATLALLHRAFRAAVGRRAWAVTLLTGIGLAMIPSYVGWAVSGLENPLYGLTVGALAAVLVRAAAGGAGPLTGTPVAIGAGLLVLAAALTRPDGVVYCAAYPMLLAALASGAPWRALRAAMLSSLTFGIPFGLLLLARRATFGQWLPNTAVAKAQRGLTVEGMAKVAGLVSYATWPIVLLAVAVVGMVAGALHRRPGTPHRPAGTPPTDGPWPAVLGLVVCLVPALIAFGGLASDWMAQYRFATPVWVTAVPLFAVCLVTLLSGGLFSRAVVGTVAVVTVASGLFAGTLLRTEGQRFRANPTVPLCVVADQRGRLFNTYADRLGIASGSLATPDVGGALLTSRLRVVDIAGLIDRKIAVVQQRDDRITTLANHLFDDVRPTFIHIHHPWDAGIADDPRLARDYVGISGGDYVRREAVRRPDQLAALQAERLDQRSGTPRGSCGDRLRPGSSFP